MADRSTPPIDPDLFHFEAQVEVEAQAPPTLPAPTVSPAQEDAKAEGDYLGIQTSRKRKSSCSSDEADQRTTRKRLPAETWEAKRPIIARLYQEEKRPLKEVMDIMQRDYEFNAT
jgi:hypothetical protein